MKRSSWIENLLLPPAVAALNAAWVTLWVLWSVRAVPAGVAAAPISPVVLALLMLGAFALTRWALGQLKPPIEPRLLLSVSGVVLVFAALYWSYRFLGPLGVLRELVDWGKFIAPEFLGLAACAFMWLQGIQLGRSPLPQENLEGTFYGGIVALGLMFAVNQLRPLITSAEALTAALAYFATGLAGLALVSIESARRAEQGVTGAWPALNRYWLGTVASVIGSILLAALLVAGLLSPQSFEQMAHVITVVVDAVTIGVIVAFGFLVYLVATAMTPVLQALSSAIGQVNLHLPSLPNFQQVSRQTLGFFERYPALNFARRGLVLGVIVGGLVLLIWWAVRRFTRRAGRDADETRESIATRELLWGQLRNLLRRWRPATPPLPPYLSLAGANDDPRLMVRRAYQAMLEWAIGLSLPMRRAGETPAAYAQVLREALPESGPAVEILTGAYVQARYAAEAPSMDAARAAQGAIHQLRLLSVQLKRNSRAA